MNVALTPKSIGTDERPRAFPGSWEKLRLALPFGLTLGAWQAHGGDHVDYRYEYYAEENNRMTIATHSVYFEQQLIDSIIAKGELVYDGISGATPTGTLDASGNVITTHMEDTRYAGNLQLDIKLGRHTLTPGFAYSEESDYLSRGISLSDAIEFNDKNTILQLGVSHDFDEVQRNGNPFPSPRGKDSTEGIVGISQLLSPQTTFSAALTFGYESGYLSDPYRLADYVPVGFPFGIGVSEQRPDHRSKEILFASLTQHIDPIKASLEVSYRFYHDSYAISAHTVGLTWHQWLGKHVMVEPSVRLYEQSAASFYTTSFSGVGIPPDPPGPPGFHSSDYRLSHLFTVDAGGQVTVIITDWMRLVAGYHRYEMQGLDRVTSPAMYPKANVFTVGVSILW